MMESVPCVFVFLGGGFCVHNQLKENTKFPLPSFHQKTFLCVQRSAHLDSDIKCDFLSISKDSKMALSASSLTPVLEHLLVLAVFQELAQRFSRADASRFHFSPALTKQTLTFVFPSLSQNTWSFYPLPSS